MRSGTRDELHFHQTRTRTRPEGDRALPVLAQPRSSPSALLLRYASPAIPPHPAQVSWIRKTFPRALFKGSFPPPFKYRTLYSTDISQLRAGQRGELRSSLCSQSSGPPMPSAPLYPPLSLPPAIAEIWSESRKDSAKSTLSPCISLTPHFATFPLLPNQRSSPQRGNAIPLCPTALVPPLRSLTGSRRRLRAPRGTAAQPNPAPPQPASAGPLLCCALCPAGGAVPDCPVQRQKAEEHLGRSPHPGQAVDPTAASPSISI